MYIYCIFNVSPHVISCLFFHVEFIFFTVRPIYHRHRPMHYTKDYPGDQFLLNKAPYTLGSNEDQIKIKKVNFQPVNTGRGAHLSLETNCARLIFRYVGLATPPPQRACYLPSIASTHLYTWVERSNYG